MINMQPWDEEYEGWGQKYEDGNIEILEPIKIIYVVAHKTIVPVTTCLNPDHRAEVSLPEGQNIEVKSKDGVLSIIDREPKAKKEEAWNGWGIQGLEMPPIFNLQYPSLGRCSVFLPNEGNVIEVYTVWDPSMPSNIIVSPQDAETIKVSNVSLDRNRIQHSC
jgi:hypothetical protein